MLQHEKHTRGVVDARIAGVGEEDGFQGGVRGEGDGVLGLEIFVPFEVRERVEQFGGPVGGEGAVAHGEDVVVPAGAGDGGGGFLAVDPVGGSE